MGWNLKLLLVRYVKIGKNCKVFPGAVIGAIPQDLKFNEEVSYVEIGDNVTIRECATINRGTAASGKSLTKIGNNTLIMSYVHVAHDCVVGNNCILTSYVGIAGETEVDDWAIVGGGSLAHQFTKIGSHAMIAGGSEIGKDVPPYALAGRKPLSYAGINIVGLRRRGFTSEQITTIKEIYNVIYQSNLNVSDACKKGTKTITFKNLLNDKDYKAQINITNRKIFIPLQPYEFLWLKAENEVL